MAGILALIVEPDVVHRVFLVSTLTSVGLDVTATDSFSRARALLVADPPAVLVTEIRLGSDNGLHLALLGRLRRPHMTVVVTSRFYDRFLRRNAEALGAAFVRKPTTAGGLFEALYRAALHEPNADATSGSTQPPPEWRPAKPRPTSAAGLDVQERRDRKRRREIATFLLLEASRR
jgi:ActR/RegA family two-component response regulator